MPLTRASSLVTFLLLASAIGSFWFLETTTPARIGSLAFLVLVSLYALSNHRPDVLGGSAFFFGVLDINQYLFNAILPIWLGAIAVTSLALVIWNILFGKEGWFLASAAILLVVELILALQYVNIELNLQSLLTILPFVIACQYFYFLNDRQTTIRS